VRETGGLWRKDKAEMKLPGSTRLSRGVDARLVWRGDEIIGFEIIVGLVSFPLWVVHGMFGFLDERYACMV